MINQFDRFLTSTATAALTIRQPLMPVEGRDAVFFPSTYAKGDGFDGGYNIDPQKGVENHPMWANAKNVCLVDSVGSQNNRIEPIFKDAPYRELVPQIVIKAGEKEINLLDAGHRAGDAIIRCSELQVEVTKAFQAILKGDFTPMAKLAPTSLVFGVWDSRESGAKVPRVVASTIRAYDVRKLTRSAQYFPATKYVSEGLLNDHGGDKKKKDQYAERGFVEVPATANHGGVIADGGIRRDATLALSAIRLLSAGNDEAATLKLRRYILSLALVAFTAPIDAYLRQGCVLVGDPENPLELTEVQVSGERSKLPLGHDAALAFAQEAAKVFGVGPSQTVAFDKAKAAKDLAKKEKTQD